MITEVDDIQALIGLGLTRSQARVYLALVNSGKMKGRAIWKKSGVARQDIYRVLTELQEKGLIEKIIANPTEYKATPIDEGLPVLLQRKVFEYKLAKMKTKELLQKYKASDDQSFSDCQFILVPERDATVHRFRLAFNSAQKSVDAIFYWEGFANLLVDATKRLSAVLEKGVKLRLIVYNSRDEKAVTRVIQLLKKKGDLEIKYALNPPPASLTIFDGEKILLTTSPTPNPLETPSLWVENVGLGSIIANYFEALWQESTTN